MSRECCLLDLPQGAKGRVRSLCGDLAERSRLLALGLTPGTEVEMCQGDTEGCRVHVRDSSIVLQGGIAERIFCDAEEPDHGRHHHHHHLHGRGHGHHEHGHHGRCRRLFQTLCGLYGEDGSAEVDECRPNSGKEGTDDE